MIDEVVCNQPMEDISEEVEALEEIGMDDSAPFTAVAASANNEEIAPTLLEQSVVETDSSSSKDPTTKTDNATAATFIATPNISPTTTDKAASNTAYWKKARVAATGGIVTAIGLVLIPAPVPVGAIVTAYGVSILATEFEGAQSAMDSAKKTVEGSFEKLAKSLDDDTGKNKVVSNEEAKAEAGAVNDEAKDVTIEQQQEASSSLPPTAVAVADVSDEPAKGEDATEEESSIVENDNTDSPPATTTASTTEESELEDIILDEKQTFMQGAGKVWGLHTRNMRKVTHRFITNTVLPGLRDMDLKRQQQQEAEPTKATEATTTTTTAPMPATKVLLVDTIAMGSSAASDMDSMAVPESTVSIVSSDASSDSESDAFSATIPVEVTTASY